LRRASRLWEPCLIDPEIDESGFQQWRGDAVRAAALDEVAQDVISLDGRALSQSRYIEEVNEDPGSVIAAACRASTASEGWWPQAVATAADSSSILSDRSGTPRLFRSKRRLAPMANCDARLTSSFISNEGLRTASRVVVQNLANAK